MFGKYWHFAALLLCAAQGQAEVLDSAANGFKVRHSVEISASRAEVYAAAVDRFSQWWNGAHSISGDAANLYIDAAPQGCFCEMLGQDAGLIHMTVTFVNPGVMLRLTGGLGPLGLMGVNGNLTWEFDDHENGSMLTWTYAVGGYLDGGLDAVAGPVDSVLIEQMLRLKALVETGENQNAL